MAYSIQIDTLIKLPKDQVNIDALKEGDVFTITKQDERLIPLHKPIEFCDHNYRYIGKVQVNKLTLEKGKTTLELEVLKIFSPEESQIYSKNYIQ